MTALEKSLGVSMRWLGTPGAFSNCPAAFLRAASPTLLLEFDSYAIRYAAAGLPVHTPKELVPHYPWSIAWRDGRPAQATADFLEIAQQTATVRGWRDFTADEAEPPWLPSDDLVAQELGFQSPMTARPGRGR